eukprot:2862899-Alexandrium_andersonii.AAC.1
MVARVFADAPHFDPDVGSPRAHHLLAALQRRVGLRQRRGRDCEWGAERVRVILMEALAQLHGLG